MAAETRTRRLATNTFLLSIIVLFFLDAFPPDLVSSNTLSFIQLNIDALLDVTGLWQGPWYLFAPETPEENIRVRAVFTYQNSDGQGEETIRHWKSPEWTEMTLWEKKRQFRMQEYIDSVRLNNNRAVWAPFAEHLARTHSIQVDGFRLHPTEVRLLQVWWAIHDPDIIEDWPESDHHWLLGHKVQNTVGELQEQNFYHWHRPDSFEL